MFLCDGKYGLDLELGLEGYLVFGVDVVLEDWRD